MAACECTSRKVLKKKAINTEEIPGAYCATITKTTYEMSYECKDCGRQWTETKEETKFE